MYTQRGPILVEVAARMQGCVDPVVIEKATNGDSNVSLTVDAYLNPHKIIAKANHAYTLSAYVLRVFIKSAIEGVLSMPPNTQAIKQLPSFASMKLACQQGSTIRRTVDLGSSPGVLHLINKDKQQLLADYETYRDIERMELFTL